MTEENISQEFRLKNIDKTRNYFIDEMIQNKLISKKHKNDIEYLFILIFTVTGGGLTFLLLLL